MADEDTNCVVQYELPSKEATRKRIMAEKGKRVYEEASSSSSSTGSDKSRKVRKSSSGSDVTNSNSSTTCKGSTLDILSDAMHPVDIHGRFSDRCPNYGATSERGRRRDMEDMVSIHPSFCHKDNETRTKFHFFGVFDGHGCSHVARTCKDRMHQLVKEEVSNQERGSEWKGRMERSFCRMDKEVVDWTQGDGGNCRCEVEAAKCDAGSTAVVSIVTPDKIVTANCGDSRAVLCRGGKAVPLSSDHKPDRPDELLRIEEAGGRVIYWDVPRVLGVLAMSRAIGDVYLKPFVCAEPEVTVTDRTGGDECMILASDGLWDVVSSETACSIARMCLNGGGSDKACSDAALLLTKIAMARNSSDNVSVIVVDLNRHL